MRNGPIVIDPGHGGVAPAGRSTPFGARGPSGRLEKDVVLDLARRVASRLGPGAAILTRSGDVNLPLAARAEVARRSGAPVFLSLHANSGSGAGPEAYVHSGAGSASRALASDLQSALSAYGGAQGRRVARGDLAVLTPSRLPSSTAAALLEVDYLSDSRGEQRLTDPRWLDRLAGGIAGGIRRYLGRGVRGLEAGGADDDAFDIGEAIPEEPAPSESGQGLPRDLATDTDYSGASRFLPARTGHYRTPAAPRQIERIVIHITDGPTTAGATSWFRSPANTGLTSSHYVVGQDGEVIQMVHDADIAHHAGGANRNSIGIEHVAESATGAARHGRSELRPSDAEYAASAALVTWLCDTYNIPPDRTHVLGHSEVDPGTTHAGCPNSVWDWDYFMRMVTSRQSLPRTQSVGQGYPAAQASYYGRRATRAQVGTLLPPPYNPSSPAESLRQLEIWQGDLNRFVVGVPPSAHAFFPHSAICKLIFDGGSQGTGFYIGGNKLLTCGHCVSGVSSMEIRPGQCGPSTPRSANVGSDALRLYPGYAATTGTDLGLVILPEGHPLTGSPAFALGELNECPSSGLIICGYASETETVDMEAAQMSFQVDPLVQHLSSGSFELDPGAPGMLLVHANLARGTSGSPTFYVASDGSTRAVGVAVSALGSQTSNGVAALDQDKIAWINAQS